MKVAFWGKGKNSLDKAVEEVLTAESAQKTADAALEAKCTRWANMIVKDAIQAIIRRSEEGYYNIHYNVYNCGKVASELISLDMTSKMRNYTETAIYNKLTSLGYRVEFGYYGPNRTIEISWE